MSGAGLPAPFEGLFSPGEAPRGRPFETEIDSTEGAASQWRLHRDGGAGAMVFGRLCLANDGVRVAEGGPAALPADAERLLAEWRREGDSFLERLSGEFGGQSPG